jgi:dATP pyrophosphohydrolase
MGPRLRGNDVFQRYNSGMPHKIPESVLVVIHTADLEVLLIERADRPGFWQSVTGSLDRLDEPLLDTAARELFEETGIVADGTDIVLRDWQLANVYEIYETWRHRYAPGVTHNTEHVFSVCVPRDIPVVLAPREHVQYAWLPLLAAADRCFSSSNAEAILQLPRRFETPL